MRGWVPPAAAGAVVGAAIGTVTTDRPADVTLFARAGQDVLTGHFAAVYGTASNQGGPLQAVLSRLLVLGSDGGPARPVLVAVDALLAALVAVLAHRAAGSRRAALALGYAALWLASPAFWGGHPLEVLIPACWLVAARRDGRTTALALAGAAAVAPWGLLGWPVVLRRGGGRSAARTVGIAGGLTAAIYAPLVLVGHGSALRHVWPVDRRSLWHLVLPQVHGVGWGVRLVQGVLVLTVLAVLAQRVPAAAPWRAPLLVTAAGLLRVATDPLGFAYYWLPAGAGALALLITVPHLRTRAGGAALALAYLVWAVPPLHLAVAPLAGLALLAAGFGPTGVGARYARQIRSSSARNRAAGSAVRGPSR